MVSRAHIENWLDSILSDCRVAFRMLHKSPGFTAIAALTLALGIGASTAIFGVIDAVLLKKLPVKNPEQLVVLNWTSMQMPTGVTVSGTISESDGRAISTSFSYPAFRNFRVQNHVFSDLAGFDNLDLITVAVSGRTSTADAAMVTGDFFTTLGTLPAAGRLITGSDDRVAAAPVAVISYNYWRRQFGRSAAAIGSTIVANGVPLKIIGVTPAGFYGIEPGSSVEVWLPLSRFAAVWNPGTSLLASANDWWMTIFGRLRPGISEEQADAELRVLLAQSLAPIESSRSLASQIPDLQVRSASRGLNDVRDALSGLLEILFAIVGLVLLASCANVAGLLLARAGSRRAEMAIRTALGASRARLVRQLLVESIMLSGFGGALGLMFAFRGQQSLLDLLSSGQQSLSVDIRPDPATFVFAVGVSIFVGVVFGLRPALRSTRVDLSPAFKGFCAGALGRVPVGRSRSGRGLVVTQITISLVLATGAALFVRSVRNLEREDFGLNPNNVLVFGIDHRQLGYGSKVRVETLYRQLLERIGALPGVGSVSMSQYAPISDAGGARDIAVEGYTPEPGEQLTVFSLPAGPDFFKTMDIPLILGRDFNSHDDTSAPKVAVVNEAMAQHFFGSSSPLGRQFRLPGTQGEFRVVGVVANARYWLGRIAPPTVYTSGFQTAGFGSPAFIEIRSAGKTGNSLAASVRGAIADVDPSLPITTITTETEIIQSTRKFSVEHLLAVLVGSLGAAVLLLACMGLYGMLSFSVARRTSEMGIRVALGAQRRDLFRLVFGEMLFLAAVGAGIGVFLIFGVEKAISTLFGSSSAEQLSSALFFGVRLTDPITLTFVAILVFGVCGLAGYFPAHRASQVDPMVALRYE